MPEPLLIPFGTFLKPEYSNGLVGHWKMNVNNGLMLPDLSGNNNHGKLTNMGSPPTATSGWAGQGLRFDGVNDYVIHTGNVVPSGDFTMQAWVKPLANGPDSYGAIFISQSQIWIAINSTGKLGGTVFGDSIKPVSNVAATLGNWYLVTLVYHSSGTLSNLYVNGVLQTDTLVHTAVYTGTTVEFGVPASHSRYYNGLIDDVRIYNRALSADEIWHSCFQQEEEWDLGLDDDLALQGIPIPILQNQVRY